MAASLPVLAALSCSLAKPRSARRDALDGHAQLAVLTALQIE
jgi:hypothetical protein